MVSNDHQWPLWTEERETSGSCDFPEAWIGRVQCGWGGKAGRVPPSHCIAFRPLTGCQSVNSVCRWQTLDSLDCPIPAIFPQIHIITGFVLSRLKPLHGERAWKKPLSKSLFFLRCTDKFHLWAFPLTFHLVQCHSLELKFHVTLNIV